jgi:hypothetical protein
MISSSGHPSSGTKAAQLVHFNTEILKQAEQSKRNQELKQQFMNSLKMFYESYLLNASTSVDQSCMGEIKKWTRYCHSLSQYPLYDLLDSKEAEREIIDILSAVHSHESSKMLSFPGKWLYLITLLAYEGLFDFFERCLLCSIRLFNDKAKDHEKYGSYSQSIISIGNKGWGIVAPSNQDLYLEAFLISSTAKNSHQPSDNGHKQIRQDDKPVYFVEPQRNPIVEIKAHDSKLKKIPDLDSIQQPTTQLLSANLNTQTSNSSIIEQTQATISKNTSQAPEKKKDICNL